jgi:hypothetical protein
MAVQRRRVTWDGENLPQNPSSIKIARTISSERIKFVDGREIYVIDENHDSYRVEKFCIVTMEFGPCEIDQFEFFWRYFQTQEEITIIFGNEFDFTSDDLDHLTVNPFDLKEWYTTYRNIVAGSLVVYRSGVQVDRVAEGVVVDNDEGKLTWPTFQPDDDTLTAEYETKWRMKVDSMDPNDVVGFKERKMLPLTIHLRETS